MAHKSKRPPGKLLQRDPSVLTKQQAVFYRAYLANGGNATRSYLEAYPLCRNHNTAAVEGSRLIREPKIAAKILEATEARYKALEMKADEAVALMAHRARMNITRAYNPETGLLLPPYLWPEELQVCLKSIKPGPFGDSYVLTDPLRAGEIILTMTGKLKSKLELNLQFDHAGYLAGNDSPDDESA